ncbi:MAG: hypothetical protein JSS12_06385 [Verrucomicrobia bacterium]|nr:hypothetical protein [Verrucomicrobiota bacterium]
MSTVRDAVSERVAKGAMCGVKSLGLHSIGTTGAARTCAHKLYEHSSAKSYARQTASLLWKALASTEFVKGKIGATGAELLHDAGSFLGPIAEDALLEQCAQSVFQPLISLIREKTIERGIKGCVGVALDTGVLWAAGGLGVLGHLDKVKQTVAVVEKVATCANLGVLAYVYGPPVVHGGKAVLQCCSFKSRMRAIENGLSDTALSAPTKKTLAAALAIVLESGGLAFAPSVDELLKDEQLLAAMVKIITAIPLPTK